MIQHAHSGALHRFWRNPHVRTELTAVEFLLLGIVGLLLGLHIAPVACLALAFTLAGSDLYSWLHER